MTEQMAAREAILLKALNRAAEDLYNPFEPNNQSQAYVLAMDALGKVASMPIVVPPPAPREIAEEIAVQSSLARNRGGLGTGEIAAIIAKHSAPAASPGLTEEERDKVEFAQRWVAAGNQTTGVVDILVGGLLAIIRRLAPGTATNEGEK